jgi:anthranilate phosphoribosyltransferase
MTFQEIIHKVGKGPHHAEDLSAEEAEFAFRFLLDGRATPLQVGGFLLALRAKSETATEVAAFARVLRERRPRVPAPPGTLDVPAYAGKARTFHALPAAAVVLAASGLPVLLHAYNEAPGRLGTGDLLRALGAGPGTLERHGLGYLDIRDYFPRLWEFLELRKELGVRSVFNVVARLLDPADARRHLIAITHLPYFEKFRGALEALGAERAAIVMGSEGEPEAPFHGVTRAVEVPGGAERSWRPEDVGLPRTRPADLPAGTLEEELALTRRILAGERLPARHVVVLTAATGLYVGGRAASWAEGVARAQETLDSGRAREKLEALAR